MRRNPPRVTGRIPGRPVFLLLLTLIVAPAALAQGVDPGLMEPACLPDDSAATQGMRRDGIVGPNTPVGPTVGLGPLTCGGTVSSPSDVHLFSGEFVHRDVDMRIRGRGFDFEWARTYRSRVGTNVGIGEGWDHSYAIRLTRVTQGPSEVLGPQFSDDSGLFWFPPVSPAGDPDALRYCTLRSTDPANFAGVATTVILDPEQRNTMTTDPDVPAPGRLFSYLVLAKNGNRPGSLGTDSNGVPRVGLPCGVTGPDLVLHDGNGRQDLYLLGAAGEWVAPEFFRTIDEPAADTYRVTFPDTSTWNLLPLDGGPAEGRIDSIVDRNDNAMTFEYDAAGRLTRITDTLDRDIGVGYDANGFLATLTDFSGRVVRYDYYELGEAGGNFGDLKSATSPAVVGTPHGNDFPRGKTTEYTYSTGLGEPRLDHNLLTITDPKGQTFLQNIYATTTDPFDVEFDRVVTQIWGDPGDRLDYFYLPLLPHPVNDFSSLLVIGNDRVGNVTEWFFDDENRVVREREHTGRAPDADQPTTNSTNRPTAPLRPGHDPQFYDTYWEYNEDSRAILIVPPNGNEMELEYDPANPGRRSQGNVRRQCRLPGAQPGPPPRICEEFDYDDTPSASGTNFVSRHVDGRGNETHHEYDAAGNRVRTTHRIPSIVEQFEYNEFGQQIRHAWPDNGSGHRRVDIFDYYESGPETGYLHRATIDEPVLSLPRVFIYDERGNPISLSDPNGNQTDRQYNALDQVVRIVSPEVEPGGPRYEWDLFYDANDNVARVDVPNVDENGAVQPNSQFTTIFEFDRLNNPVETCRESGDHTGPIPGTPQLPTCVGVGVVDWVLTEFQYDANRNRTLVRFGEAANGNQPGNAVSREFDERDLLFEEVRGEGTPAQSTTRFDYDGNANIVRVAQGLEETPHVRVQIFDGYDRPITAIDPMGNETTVEYDANDNQVRRRVDGENLDLPGGAGNVPLFDETFVFDEMDRPTSNVKLHFDSTTQTPILDGLVNTTFGWSDNSQVILFVDDNGNPTTFDYDSANRLARTTDAAGNSVELEYDSNDNVVHRIEVEKSDAGAPDETYVTVQTYDGLDRRTSTTDNVGNTTEFRYDSRGNRVVVEDALRGTAGPGNIVRFEFDGLDRQVATERVLTDDGTGSGTPIGVVRTTQQWDDSSRLVSRTDDGGNTTTYHYDELNRLVEEVAADGTNRFVIFDVHDLPRIRFDANGTQTELFRDLNDRLIVRDVIRGPSVLGTTFEAFDHDGLSRVVGAFDDDSQVERRYDSLGNLVQETLNGQTTSFEHDGVGNRKQMVYPGGRQIGFDHDALNRVRAILEGPGTLAAFEFVGPARVQRRVLGNGTQTQFEYDGLTNQPGDFGVRRVVRTVHSGPSGAIDDRVYRWDPMMNKRLIQDTTPGGQGRGRAYALDSLYRLVQSDHFDAAGPTGFSQYGLDGVTNRLNVNGGPDPGAYGMDGTTPEPADQQLNQYTRTPFDNREYDPNGNLVAIDPGTAQFRGMTYDYANRMVQHVDAAGGTDAEYAYDAFGRRIARTVSAGAAPVTTNFFYDGWRVIEEQDGAGATEATYVYGRWIDEPLTMNRGGSDFFFHGDEQYSTVKLTDGAGNVVESVEYEDYGEPEVFNAAGNPLPGSAVGNPYLFQGRRFDPETGFYYYRNRYLDPRAGRFTTRDPIGIWGDPSALGNGYTFAGGNPATNLDPLGLMIYVKIPPIGGVATTDGWSAKGYFVADSFSFGVEREMKESGEKGGTEDINIGIGELQECTISKSMDWASPTLAQFAINGNSPGTAEIDFVEVAGGGAAAAGKAEIEFVEVAGSGLEGKPICYLKYKLDRCWVKSWSTSGDADDRPTEEVAFYYNKIAFAYAPWAGGLGGLTTGLPGMMTGWGANGYFSADSFSFGVEREMKESGEKGGTTDMNIGLGELQE